MQFLDPLTGLVSDKQSLWLTPVWILCVGVAGGLLLLAIAWAVLRVTHRPLAARVWEMLTEGPMKVILGMAVCLGAFAIVGLLAVREPGTILASVVRLPATADRHFTLNIEPSIRSHFIPIERSTRELKRVELTSDQPLYVDSRGSSDDDQGLEAQLTPGQTLVWRTDAQFFPPFPKDYVQDVEVRNSTGAPAELAVSIITTPVAGDEVLAVPITAAALFLLVALYVAQNLALPKMSAIALATAKSEIWQPPFLITVAVGSFAILLFIWLPYNTFGEDIKMLKDTGLTVIMLGGIGVALLAASNSVADEIDGRTALTVLSKPVGRAQFIFGKLAGILWMVAALFVLLSVVFLISVAYKPIHDARETANADPTWQQCQQEMIQIVPGIVLAFMETVVLAALSVAISTRLPLLANLTLCLTIYALGHLTPLIVQSQAGGFAPVAFVGLFLATLLPVLENFNISAAIAGGREVPYVYLGMSLIYCTLYTAVAILLALVLFEDRDVA